MKKTMTILLIAITATTVAFSQTNEPKNTEVTAQIIALEKQNWEAFKNKDAAWVQSNATEEFLNITSWGVATKSEYIKSLADCVIKSFELNDFKFVMLDKNAVLLTYTSTLDGVCGGQPLPKLVRASANYVRRGGKWLVALYMETPVAQ